MHHKCIHFYGKCLDNLAGFDKEAERIFMSQGDLDLALYRNVLERAADSFLRCWSVVHANADMALISLLGFSAKHVVLQLV
jgi:hypothetical protein